jgi:hypothetical protein
VRGHHRGAQGGHTEAFLESGANVLALDRDPDAIQHVSEQLARFGKRLAVRQANFRCAISVLDELGIRTIGGALLDIGVSSRQLENSERGFSFMRNGPLDMRMDPRGQLTAAAIVNEYSEEELTRLFRELGEEPAARRIASLIVKMRKSVPFRETLPLARAIEKLVGRHGLPVVAVRAGAAANAPEPAATPIRPARPAAGRAQSGPAIDGLLVRGLYLWNARQQEVVVDYFKNLVGSPFFKIDPKNQQRVIKPTMPNNNEWAFPYELQLDLKQPLPLP